MKKKFTSALFILSLGTLLCYAQDDLMKTAQAESKPVDDVTLATFKATRLINQPTLECLGPRTLDFKISHRFGTINSGSYNAWGIDGPANLRLGLDYSYDGRLMIGIGRSSAASKLYDAFLKYRLLRQKDNGKMPVSVTLFTSIAYTAQEDQTQSATGQDKYFYTTDRLSYAHEIIIGRKFSSKFSLQASGFLVHNNLVQNTGDKNDIYLLAGAARIKLTKSFSLTAEYAYRLNEYTTTPEKYDDSVGAGIEIETGGHVFQIFVTNSFSMSETEYLPFTSSVDNGGGLRVGFNISRVFHL